MFIDTHCHLSENDYKDIEEVIKNNINSGVEKIIISGCSKASILESIDISSQYDNIYVTVGYHPDQVLSVTDYDLKELEKIIKKNNKVVGLGEIGLDYHYGKDNKDLQISLFEKQLVIAERLNIPVVIHSRDAVKDTIDILKKYKVHGVIHCFSGSLETANIYIKMGFLLGIGGVVTFKNSNLSLVVKEMGMENIVLETDSPYLTPEPYRGQQNSSKYIPIIAEKIANIKNIPIDEVEATTTINAIKVFDLN